MENKNTLNECYFVADKKFTSATICANCGKEKMLHTIGDGVKASQVIITNEERWCSVNAFVAACTAISKIPSQKIETIDDVNNFQDLLKQQGYSILPISLEQRIEELKGIIKILGTTA